MKIALLASTSIVLASLSVPAYASVPLEATASILSQQTIECAKVPVATATSTFAGAVNGGATGEAGTTEDVGLEYDVTNKRPLGTPVLTNQTINSALPLHLNGGSQNLFGKGTATATYNSYLYDAKQNTSTPVTFTYGCSVTETITLPDIEEVSQMVRNQQCVADVTQFRADYAAYERALRDLDAFEKEQDRLKKAAERNGTDFVPGNPPFVPAKPTIPLSVTNPNEATVGVDDCPQVKVIITEAQDGGISVVPRPDLARTGLTASYDYLDTRLITDATKTESFVDNNFALDNLLACNSPDSLGGAWVNKHGYTGTCSAEATRLGVVLSFKRR